MIPACILNRELLQVGAPSNGQDETNFSTAISMSSPSSGVSRAAESATEFWVVFNGQVENVKAALSAPPPADTADFILKLKTTMTELQQCEYFCDHITNTGLHFLMVPLFASQMPQCRPLR